MFVLSSNPSISLSNYLETYTHFKPHIFSITLNLRKSKTHQKVSFSLSALFFKPTSNQLLMHFQNSQSLNLSVCLSSNLTETARHKHITPIWKVVFLYLKKNKKNNFNWNLIFNLSRYQIWKSSFSRGFFLMNNYWSLKYF